jgi:hypothetical protein
MGCTEGIAMQALEGLSVPHGRITYDIMDEDVVIDLVISGGGEAAC